MNDKLLMPWRIFLPDHNCKSMYIRVDMLLDTMAYCFSTIDDQYAYSIKDEKGIVIDVTYHFTSANEAMEACNRALLELGYEFISEERAKRLELLL